MALLIVIEFIQNLSFQVYPRQSTVAIFILRHVFRFRVVKFAKYLVCNRVVEDTRFGDYLFAKREVFIAFDV